RGELLSFSAAVGSCTHVGGAGGDKNGGFLFPVCPGKWGQPETAPTSGPPAAARPPPAMSLHCQRSPPAGLRTFRFRSQLISIDVPACFRLRVFFALLIPAQGAIRIETDQMLGHNRGASMRKPSPLSVAGLTLLCTCVGC